MGLGVCRSYFCAVGEPEVVDLVLAQRRSHHIHVPGGGRGSDAGQKLLAHPRLAALRELAVQIFDVGDACAAVVGVRFPTVGVEFGVGAAAQFGGGVPDAAGVEADQVEPAANVGVGERGAHAHDGVDRRRPWPAGIHHQHPDAVTGRGYADDRQLCLCAFGIGVIERDGHGAALCGRNVTGVAGELFAAAPHRRLAVGLGRLPLGRAPMRRGTRRPPPARTPAASRRASPPATWQSSSHARHG